MNEYAFASAPTPEELAKFDPNDLGNAMRLIRLIGGAIDDDGGVDAGEARLLFQLGGGWIGFNGRYWDRPYGEELARKSAHLVARKLASLNKLIADAHFLTVKESAAFIKSAGSSGSTQAMLRQAQSYLTVEIDAFDQDPLALNVRNGTLKLRPVDGALKVTLDRHNPADRITKMAAVAYDVTATAPLFEQVADESFPDKAEGAYFQRTCGYGSTGIIREQAFFLNQGRGRDGKSTLLDAIRKTLGTYAEVGDVNTFLEGVQGNAGGPSPDLVKLAGDVRFVVLSEPKRGAAWNEARLKAWTSGSPIMARDLNAKPFNFKPIGKLFIECNPFPKPRGDDDGFWRRIKPTLFRRQVPKAEVDQEMPDKIAAAELPGVLNWLLAGVGDWLCGGEDHKGGLRMPASLEGVLDAYRKSSSPFGDWLDERCVWGEAAGKAALTSSTELYNDYKAWSEGQGHDKPMSMRAFGDALSDRQVLVMKRDNTGRKIRGPIRLKTAEERDLDAANSPITPPLVPDANEASPSAGGSSGVAPGAAFDADLADNWGAD